MDGLQSIGHVIKVKTKKKIGGPMEGLISIGDLLKVSYQSKVYGRFSINRTSGKGLQSKSGHGILSVKASLWEVFCHSNVKCLLSTPVESLLSMEDLRKVSKNFPYSFKLFYK